ncbi:MAG: flagellar hook-length control protein FliK [Azonexus sp.]|uniref:flagellar hook-length control protein FliK n=1 Tax=Azonexus sp. TaxID=1872668 RepID=UPI0028352AA3|nr:flagellar hook-length control protein FliK [Azonexus sp.]MDR0777729.1 flagellar hook-length control protein FliK [Azonexus sp.]
MGITVFPALSGNVLPGVAPASGVAEVEASGGFAALLSSELLSQVDILAELGGGIVVEKAKDRLAAEDQPAAEDKPDLSLFASLFGPPAGAELAPRSIASTAGGEFAPRSIAATVGTVAGHSPRIDSSSGRVMPEALAVKTGSQEAGVFEKLAGSGKEAAAAAPGIQAANIAVETDAGEKPSVFASHLAASSAAGAPASHAANTAQPSVAAPLHSPVWPQQFSDRIVWLARNEQQTAQLNINPPQLGPVQVTLKLNGDQANIVFASPHADVRQAIENAMPQLKEMLSSAGINLGQANVGPNLQQQRGDTPFGEANGTRFADENAILPASEKGASAAGATVVQRGRGLVDLFA